MDIKKLKAKCIEKGITLGTLAEVIGLSRTTLSRRMKSNTLTIKNVHDIKVTLSLTIEEVISIFFTKCVA